MQQFGLSNVFFNHSIYKWFEKYLTFSNKMKNILFLHHNYLIFTLFFCILYISHLYIFEFIFKSLAAPVGYSVVSSAVIYLGTNITVNYKSNSFFVKPELFAFSYNNRLSFQVNFYYAFSGKIK